MKKWVYNFTSEFRANITGNLKLLGGKGASLAEISKLGIAVPPGFTLTTEVCSLFYQNDKQLPEPVIKEIKTSFNDIEKSVNLRFAEPKNPLLVSIRSGAPVSMPGMMDTILNLGLNDHTVEGLAEKTKNSRFAYDCYRRLIQMYGDVVLKVDHYHFESILTDQKHRARIFQDYELKTEHLLDIINKYKKVIKKYAKREFPQDVNEQLLGAISAVFDSWMNPRAVAYREINGIPGDSGTAVNIQSMVFGNKGNSSATGVVFTRNPATGNKEFYGEFLLNAQGEDVVAGIRTPQQITIQGKEQNNSLLPAMEEVMPNLYEELKLIADKLEDHYADIQDIEFTIEEGKLWILQTRSAKRTAAAAIKVAIDLAKEGKITKEKALHMVSANSLEQLLHPTLDPKATPELLCKGLPASPGAISGIIVLTSEKAKEIGNKQKVILVREETSPEDIAGMSAAAGILTSRGGMTSHAAVVARGMGKPCITGANQIVISLTKQSVNILGTDFKEGDTITINGATGEVFLGEVATIFSGLTTEFTEFMSWVDESRDIKVLANADTPKDAEMARYFGAEGIGLCRTEHMFFSQDRIKAVREMILAQNTEERAKALEKLLPYQRQDFREIFEVMQGLPVTIRLLDPPLHEFLPKGENEITELSKMLGINAEEIKARIKQLEEHNPMLGHRGVRLAITYPEIYEMQVKAILEAACDLYHDKQMKADVEIMIPLIMDKKEYEIMTQLVSKIHKQVSANQDYSPKYKLGTMIELPRAAITAAEIAKEAGFFSFGTNDLTQTTLGISRDDAARFIKEYKEKGIFEKDPFVTIDIVGVGELIRNTVLKSKAVKPELKIGVCGEHGGDPKSIEFFAEIGIDYVSCSPFRVPIARLAAAQAILTRAQNLKDLQAA